MLLKNWKTTLLGIIAWLTAVWHCFHAGTIDLNCITTAILGTGLLVAKDKDVTGGTIPQTPEAVSRVEKN